MFENDPYLRQVQLNRCELIAIREEIQEARREEAKRDSERRIAAQREDLERTVREQQARQREMQALDERAARESKAQAARGREAPARIQPPELGESHSDAAASCLRQGGRAVGTPSDTRCFVGQLPASGWKTNDGRTITSTTGYFEGVTPQTLVQATTSQLGEPDRVEALDGSRVVIWIRGDRAYGVGSTATGAWLSIVRLPDP